MVALKLWFDTRSRFLIGIVVMIFLALLLSWSFYAVNKVMGQNGAGANAKIGAETKSEVMKVWSSYETIVDAAWYESYGAGMATILAIIMALGGPLADSQSVHLTLSLPVRRYRWLVAQVMLTLALTVVMMFVSTAVLLAVGALMGHTYPPGQAALNVLLSVVPVVAWVGLTLAVGSFALDKARTALIVIPANFISAILFALPVMRAWNMNRLGRPLSMHPVLSWKPFLLLIVCAVGGVATAAWRYEQRDY